jgi:Lar family restriction alleviation protein
MNNPEGLREQIELKPCPFCGGEAEVNQIGNEHTKSRGFEVKCLTWGCSTKKRAMVIRQPIEKAREFAAAAWNRRAPADAIISGPLQERVEELEGAVRIAAVAFRQYEALHLAKGTQDGDEKAQRNHERAARMEAALSHKEGEGNV